MEEGERRGGVVTGDGCLGMGGQESLGGAGTASCGEEAVVTGAGTGTG